MTKDTNVDTWLKRETEHKRKALENASAYFGKTDPLTVNTLEAIYGKESSFGTLRRKRGMSGAAGEFHLEKITAEKYGLHVTKGDDQRFDIDYASITAARYLKDLYGMFGKRTILADGIATIPIEDSLERMNFVLAAYNGGEGSIARTQDLAQKAGKDPRNWNDVKGFLKKAKPKSDKSEEIREYVEAVSKYEAEFASKSSADKRAKYKKIRSSKDKCNDGHWITKDGHHIFICA